MKRLMFISVCLFLGACSSSTQRYLQNTQQEFTNHNYYQIVEAMELDQLFPGRAERTEKELKNNCLEGAERRVVTFSGSDEPFHYSECPHTPYPANFHPHRF